MPGCGERAVGGRGGTDPPIHDNFARVVGTAKYIGPVINVLNAVRRLKRQLIQCRGHGQQARIFCKVQRTNVATNIEKTTMTLRVVAINCNNIHARHVECRLLSTILVPA